MSWAGLLAVLPPQPGEVARLAAEKFLLAAQHQPAVGDGGCVVVGRGQPANGRLQIGLGGGWQLVEVAEALDDEVQLAQPLEVGLGPVGLGGGDGGQAAQLQGQGGGLGVYQPVGHGVPVAFGAVGQAGQAVAHQVGEPQRELVEAGLQVGQLGLRGVAAGATAVGWRRRAGWRGRPGCVGRAGR
jgi:hypothetical protein